jgi:hypothetical protein
MIGDPCQHLAQIVLWIEAVQLGGFDQRVCRRRPLAAGVRTGK